MNEIESCFGDDRFVKCDRFETERIAASSSVLETVESLGQQWVVGSVVLVVIVIVIVIVVVERGCGGLVPRLLLLLRRKRVRCVEEARFLKEQRV